MANQTMFVYRLVENVLLLRVGHCTIWHIEIRPGLAVDNIRKWSYVGLF